MSIAVAVPSKASARLTISKSNGIIENMYAQDLFDASQLFDFNEEIQFIIVGKDYYVSNKTRTYKLNPSLPSKKEKMQSYQSRWEELVKLT